MAPEDVEETAEAADDGGLRAAVEELTTRVDGLERGLTHHFHKLQRLVQPMVPSAYNMITNLLRFSALYVASSSP